MEFEKTLLTEKYRPKTLSEIAIPERLVKLFENGVTTNVLLQGPPGCGKTSLAKLLVKQFNHPYIYINASSEGRIDFIRNQITEFCSQSDLMSNDAKKVVILDEVDGASAAFFDAFKVTVEKFSSNTRFILTSNHINKIPDAVQSRFNVIDFNFKGDDFKQVFKKSVKIFKTVCHDYGIKFENDKILYDLIIRLYPKLRNVLVKIESWVQSGVNTVSENDAIGFVSDYNEFYENIFSQPNPVQNYSFVKKYKGLESELMSAISEELPDFIIESKPKYQDLIFPMAILIADYQLKMEFVANSFNCLLACFADLQRIFYEHTKNQ